jgi:hypothetical protein
VNRPAPSLRHSALAARLSIGSSPNSPADLQARTRALSVCREGEVGGQDRRS